MRTTNRGSKTALAAAALLLLGTVPALAQTDQDQRIEALERSLEAIKESIAAGQDVSARIQALEQELARLKAEMAAESPPQVAAVAKQADDGPEPGEQGAPNPLQDDKQYLTGADLLDASFPNSFPIPGTDVRMRIGGYAKADFIQDLDYVGDPYEFELATIPIDGTPNSALDGRTTFHAKETRLNFDFRSKAKTRGSGKEYPLQAFLEIDFFDDRRDFSLQPRLRHAYGVMGRLLVGRTWNTSGDLASLPGTIDFSGGDALYGGRVTQIRWQDKIGETTTWAVALEEPSSSIGNPLGFGGQDRQSLPALAGKIRWEDRAGSHLQLGADLFQLRWQGGDAGPGDNELGFGINVTGRLLLGSARRNALIGGGTIGQGSAHRVIALSWDGGNDAVITANGLDIIPHWQAYAGYSHYWNDYLNSTLAAGWTELDNADAQPGTTIHRAQSLHLNLIWFPYELVSTGVEIMWGERANKDGGEGDAIRMQYMVKYKFN